MNLTAFSSLFSDGLKRYLAKASNMVESPTLGSVIRPAFGDAAAILRHRLLPAVLLALATLCLAMYAVAVTRSLDAVAWADWPGLWAVGFLLYADAMRIVLVPYSLTIPNLVKWVAVNLIIVASTLVCVLALLLIMAPFRLNPHIYAMLQLLAFYASSIFFDARFCFAVFALKDYGVLRACIRSWSLTGKRALLPTLLLFAAFDIAWFLMTAELKVLRHTIEPFNWIILKVLLSFVLLLLSGSFLYPALARWMLVCERLRSSDSR